MVYASYVSTNGTLVLGFPTLVVSVIPPGAVLTGIDIGETEMTLNPGDQVFLHIFGEYSDGSRIPELIPVGESVSLLSSDDAVVSVDPTSVSLQSRRRNRDSHYHIPWL